MEIPTQVWIRYFRIYKNAIGVERLAVILHHLSSHEAQKWVIKPSN